MNIDFEEKASREDTLSFFSSLAEAVLEHGGMKQKTLHELLGGKRYLIGEVTDSEYLAKLWGWFESGSDMHLGMLRLAASGSLRLAEEDT